MTHRRTTPYLRVIVPLLGIFLLMLSAYARPEHTATATASAAEDSNDSNTSPPTLIVTIHEPQPIPNHTLATINRQVAIQQAMQQYRISHDLAAHIYDSAVEHNIDPTLAFGLVSVESAFDSTAISHAGAIGLAQLMPTTARSIRPGTTEADLKRVELNLDLGFRHLRWLIHRYNGDEKLALLAYNRGHGTIERAIANGHDPDNGYARKVDSRRLRSPVVLTG